MAAIEIRRGLAPENMRILLEWANSGGEDFLRQFAGPKWRYPLTADQIGAEAEGIFSIYAGGCFAGIVQELYRREGRAHIGRFLLDPARRGTGIGTEALAMFCRRLFKDEGIAEVTLRVYRFNSPAIQCYRKCGFALTEDGGGDPWDSLPMALRREELPREGGAPAASNMTLPCDGGLVNLRVGAIIVKNGQFLMAGNDRDAYLYSVGGRIRFGETAEEAVVREVEEETGRRLEVDRLGFVHENYFTMDIPPNDGKLVYEISFYFYMKVPPDFEPVGESRTDDGSVRETMQWVSPDDPRTIYPAFFRTELSHREHTVKHFVTDERMSKPRRVDAEIVLIPYYPNESVALTWYQDAELCRQVDNRAEPYTPERLRAMYAFLSSHGKCYYIEYRGTLVGDVTLRDDGEIAIVLCREYQNRGIGRRCVRDMLALARESGMAEVRAHIYAFNAQSQRMFRSVGFEKTEDEWYHYRIKGQLT